MDFDKIYKGEMPKMPELPAVGGIYWYIVVKSPIGSGKRAVVAGPYSTEEEAERLAVENLDSDYEIVPMKTRDRARATQELKHRRWKESGDLPAALRRMRHKL